MDGSFGVSILLHVNCSFALEQVLCDGAGMEMGFLSALNGPLLAELINMLHQCHMDDHMCTHYRRSILSPD